VCKEREEKCNVCRRVDRVEDNKEVEEATKSGESRESSKDSSYNKKDIDTVKAKQDKAQQVFKQQQLA
jgi:hypothetical protein